MFKKMNVQLPTSNGGVALLHHLMKSYLLLMIWAVLLACVFQPTVAAACEMGAYAGQREQMVAWQIKARGVRDHGVLRAMQVVPRHCFVPLKLQSKAYQDHPLPIGHGQTISQPYIVALMTELLALKPGQRILEIGTGSGYQAAILAQMAVEVFTIEILAPLARQARDTLKRTGFSGVHTKIGDGYKGWPDQAPFDGIIVTCAPTHIPEPLKVQLVEGGRMVIPVGQAGGVQQLYLMHKEKGRLVEKKRFDVRFVPMTREKKVD